MQNARVTKIVCHNLAEMEFPGSTLIMLKNTRMLYFIPYSLIFFPIVVDE